MYKRLPSLLLKHSRAYGFNVRYARITLLYLGMVGSATILRDSNTGKRYIKPYGSYYTNTIYEIEEVIFYGVLYDIRLYERII